MRTLREELKELCGIDSDNVPDGVLEFKHPRSKDSFPRGTNPDSYKDWYWTCKSFPGTYISKIVFRGTYWSVGEETTRGKIEEIEWRGGGWMTRFGSTWIAADLNLKKPMSIEERLTRIEKQLGLC